MIYLDNSATTYPKPPQVIRAVDNALRSYSFNPGRGGYGQSLRTAQKVYEARETVRDFFNAPSAESVIFTPGCTYALNTAIKGVLKKGDHVIISSFEHNAVLRPIYRLEQRGIISYSVAVVDPADDEVTLQNFRELINPHTRMIVCTHASNVFGFRLPVERICALAHSYNILFCLDAAQTAGLIDIDLNENKYDMVCCAGHKYLYGPMGTGLLLIGNDMEIEPLAEGGTGSLSSEADMPPFLPDRLEAGTANIAGICGLQAGIRFVEQRGIGRISEAESKLIDHLYADLKSYNNINAYKNDNSVPVLSFTVEGKDSETIVRYLSENYGIAVRGGLHCAPLAHKSMGTSDTGTVRISPSAYTSREDMNKLLYALRKIV